MSKGTKSNTGCITGAIVAFILLALSIPFALFAFLRIKRMEQVKQATTAMDPGFHSLHSGELQGVSIPLDSIRQYSAIDLPEPVPAEHYVALMAAENTTTLARNSFIEAANGKRAEWELKVQDMLPRDDGTIAAHFRLPYWLTSESGSTGSLISVYATFPPESRDSLLGLRSGDWIRIGGTLEFGPDGSAGSGKNGVILNDPEIVTKTAGSSGAEKATP